MIDSGSVSENKPRDNKKFRAKALVAQRKNAKLLNANCSWRAFLCAFAPLRELLS
jgi:hypothetical protein